MGDHFVLIVNRLLTESTLEAAIGSRNHSKQTTASVADEEVFNCPARKTVPGDDSSPRKIVECRICQDEDEDTNMETPCSCSGSLKYAHRHCVQRWCNEKGNIICEICHQEFQPGYTTPLPLFQLGRIPMNFRGNWEVSRRDLDRSRLMEVISSANDYSDSESEENAASIRRSTICCRSIALIFMVLLILRHTLPLLIGGQVEYSFPLFALLLVRTVGIILPIYVIVRAVTAIKRYQRIQQEPPASSISSDEETDDTALETQLRVIDVQ